MKQSTPHEAGSRSRAWLAGACILLIALTAGSSAVTAREITLNPSQSAKLLQAMSISDEKLLKSLPGMTPDAVARILAFRKGGKSFASLSQVREVSGLSSEQFDKVQERFSEMESSPKDSIGGAQKGQAATRNTMPQAKGGPSLNLEVKSGYFSILPGYDLEKLDPQKRKRFLDTINSEMCGCGCSDDTLGSCLVNDPGCVVVKARVKQVYTDIFGSAPPAPAGTGAAH